MYDHHCTLLTGPLASSDSVTYGVNERSVLNDIDHYHVTTQMPQDIMHVLFEGVIPKEVKLMLEVFIGKKYFTLYLLNERIRCFPYGRSEAKNKPPKTFEMHHITEGQKLPLSGATFCNWLV